MPILWSPAKHCHALLRLRARAGRAPTTGTAGLGPPPDLARQTLTPPASVGKYADSVTPAEGAITALSASPLSLNVLWAGTDDGNVQMTQDGGATGVNAPRPGSGPDQGLQSRRRPLRHPHRATAASAAPCAWTTRARISSGPTTAGRPGPRSTRLPVCGGGPRTRSARRSAHERDCSTAATETQVWVSFDDGDHWQAISVRDIQVKDARHLSLGADPLVAATHGRGFWILDDVTPLREAVAAERSKGAYLFTPRQTVCGWGSAPATTRLPGRRSWRRGHPPPFGDHRGPPRAGLGAGEVEILDANGR